MTSSSVLRRALLYVPATSQKMLQKSLSLTPDTLMYDLEDSVAAHLKPAARTTLSAFLSPSAAPSPSSSSSFPSRPRPEIAVRINSPSTPHALADLTDLLLHGSHNIDALIIPKVDSAADLTFVTSVLHQLLPERHSPHPPAGSKPPIQLLALIESARAVTDLRAICAASPYLSGLIFAAEDFALSLSLTRTPSLTEFLFARQSLVTHAAAAGLPSIIDLVHTSYSRLPPTLPSDASVPNPEWLADAPTRSLEAECARGREMGFTGKQCIHPSQVALVQAAFSPGEREVEWAVRVVVADAKAAEEGRGAWTLDGKMVDAPVVGRARRIVERAERCGIDVKAVRERWAGEVPQ